MSMIIVVPITTPPKRREIVKDSIKYREVFPEDDNSPMPLWARIVGR